MNPADFFTEYAREDHAPEFPHEQEHQDHADGADGDEHQGDNPGDEEETDHRQAAEEFAALAAEATSAKETHALAQLATAHATLHIGDMLAAWFIAIHAPGIDEALGEFIESLGPINPPGPDLSPLLPCGASLGLLPCLLPVHGEEVPHAFGDADDGAR